MTNLADRIEQAEAGSRELDAVELANGWEDILDTIADKHDVYIGDANDYDPIRASPETVKAFLCEFIAAAAIRARSA